MLTPLELIDKIAALVEKYRLFDAAPYPLYGLIHDVVQEPVDVAQKFRGYGYMVQLQR